MGLTFAEVPNSTSLFVYSAVSKQKIIVFIKSDRYKLISFLIIIICYDSIIKMVHLYTS